MKTSSVLFVLAALIFSGCGLKGPNDRQDDTNKRLDKIHQDLQQIHRDMQRVR